MQYALILFRNRDELRELRRIEMTIEADYMLNKLDAQAAGGEEQVAEMMRKAEAARDQRRADEFEPRRAQLPTTLKKLTAGYELRCYWFEIFECGRKVALVCLPVFVSPGSAAQLILGLIICFLTCDSAPRDPDSPQVATTFDCVRVALWQTACTARFRRTRTRPTTCSLRWRSSPSSSRSSRRS